MEKEWQDVQRQDEPNKVRVLLKQGMDISAKDQHGQTAFMYAAHAGQPAYVPMHMGGMLSLSGEEC